MPAEHSQQNNGLSRLQIRRALRLWWWEGGVATAQDSLSSGAFATGFALLLGCNDFVLGLLAALPAFTGLVQLYAANVATRLGSRRAGVAWPSLLSRLCWPLIVVIPFMLPRPLWVGTFLFLVFVAGALINVSNPLWAAWLSDLVPEDNRGRYFGRLNQIGGVVGMVTAIGGGAFLDAMARHGTRFGAFAALFGVGVVFSLAAFVLVWRSPDVEKKREEEAPPAPQVWPLTGKPVERGEGEETSNSVAGSSAPAGTVRSKRNFFALPPPKLGGPGGPKLLSLVPDLAPLHDANFRGIILLAVCVAAAVGVAGQFFTVYQIKTLGLNYTALQTLGAAGAVASLLSMPMWGYLGDKYGSRPILTLACALTLPAPVLWLLTVPDGIPGLWAVGAGGIVHVSWTKLDIVFLNTLSGAGWAGIGLAQFNLMMGAAPTEKRAAYIAVLSAAAGVAGGVAPLFGGAIVTLASHISFPAHGLVRSPYHVVFLVSLALRGLFFPLLARIEETGSRSTRYVLGQLKASKPMGAAAGINALSRGKSAGVRGKAARHLAKLKTPVAVEELVAALDDVALPVREEAAAALGEIGDRRALGPLLRKLSDPASGIDAAAALALGKIGDGEAFPSLAAMAQLGPPTRQLAAIHALGALSDPRAIEVLTDLAKQPAVRLPALRALGEREDPHTAPFLTAQLTNEKDAATLATLADALGRVGNDSSVLPLLDALDNAASPTVRREILNAVGSLVGGRDAFYPFLTLDAAARDETVSKTLLGLERRFRTRAAREGEGARRAARARGALRSYAEGDGHGCLRSLAALGILIVAGSPSVPCDALLRLAERDTPGPEEVLLGVFLARVLADMASDGRGG